MEKVVKSSPDLRIRSSQRAQDETPYQMNGNGGNCLPPRAGGKEGGREDGGRGEGILKEKDGCFQTK